MVYKFCQKITYIIKCGKSPSFTQISSVLSMIEAEPKDYHLNPHCILHAGTPFNLSKLRLLSASALIVRFQKRLLNKLCYFIPVRCNHSFLINIAFQQ